MYGLNVKILSPLPLMDGRYQVCTVRYRVSTVPCQVCTVRCPSKKLVSVRFSLARSLLLRLARFLSNSPTTRQFSPIKNDQIDSCKSCRSLNVQAMGPLFCQLFINTSAIHAHSMCISRLHYYSFVIHVGKYVDAGPKYLM